MKALLNKNITGIADQGLTSASSFLLGLFIVNKFGLNSYGVYAGAWLIYLFFSSMFQSFIVLPSMVLRKTDEAENNRVLANRKLADLILLPSVLFVFGIIHLAFQMTPIETTAYTVLITTALRLDLLRKFFYAVEKNQIAFLGSAIVFTATLLLFVTFYFFYAGDMVLFVFGLSGVMILGNIYYMFRIQQWKKSTGAAREKLPLKENWQYAKSLLATNVLQWISSNFIQIAVLGVLGNAMLGALKMLQNILGLLHVIFLALENIIPAKSSRILKVHGKLAFRKFLKKSVTMSGLLFLGSISILLLFPEFILRFLYSNEMMEYAVNLQQFTLVYILVFMGTWLQLVLKVNAKNAGILFAYIGTLVIGYLCAEPFVKFWGLSGAILTFAVLQVFANTVYFISIKKYRLI